MQSELERLFGRGTLVRPSDKQPNLVHLIRAIAALCGVDKIDLSPPASELVELIGPAAHVVFVLLDGMGMNLVERLPQDAFVRKSLRRQIQATCPSTTACALTTVATAEYPSRHGVVGWFTHIPQMSLTATILPFKERFSEQPLTQRGITPRDVLPLPVIGARMPRKMLTVTPVAIAHTSYNDWSRGGTEGIGYLSIPDAVDQIVRRVNSAGEPTYTHLYLPEIDTICHKLGTEHAGIVPEIMKIDEQLERLCDSLKNRARVVICADHGLIDVPIERQILLVPGDSLLDTLLVPPSGDARMPLFHVRPGEHGSFVHQARERFGDRMLFISTDEVEKMELLGPGKLSEVTRRRLGDFAGIPFQPATLAFHPANKPLGHLFKAVHGGLSPQEMRVPLCIA